MKTTTREQERFIADKLDRLEGLRLGANTLMAVAIWMTASMTGLLEFIGFPAWMISDTNAMEWKILTFVFGFIGLRAYVSTKKHELTRD